MKLQILTKAKDASELQTTPEGYWVIRARVSRSGVLPYMGYDIGSPFDGSEFVPLFRPPEEVGSAASLATYAHMPICVGHPWDDVTIANWDEYAVGEMSTDAEFINGFVEVTLWFKSPRVIAAILSGDEELSLGFTYLLTMEDGEYNGVPYRGRQSEIEINHIAVVPRGRAGAECCIRMTGNDSETRYAVRVDNREATDVAPTMCSANEESNMTELKTKAFNFGKDAFTLPVAEGVAVKSAYDALVADHATALAEQKTAHDEAIATSAAELKTANDKIKELEGKQATDADIEARVETRSALLDSLGKSGLTMETKGATDHDIRVALVNHRTGADTYNKDSDVDTVKVAYDTVSQLPETKANGLAGATLKGADASTTENAHGVHGSGYQKALDAFNPKPQQKEA